MMLIATILVLMAPALLIVDHIQWRLAPAEDVDPDAEPDMEEVDAFIHEYTRRTIMQTGLYFAILAVYAVIYFAVK